MKFSPILNQSVHVEFPILYNMEYDSILYNVIDLALLYLKFAPKQKKIKINYARKPLEIFAIGDVAYNIETTHYYTVV